VCDERSLLSSNILLKLMTKRHQRGAVPAYSLWMRTLALACLMLVGSVSFAQAVHIHGEWLPENSHKATVPADASQLPGGEERCPLCIAMHSALPVSIRVAEVRRVLVVCKPTQVLDHAPESKWHFAMFSRPPPVVETL